MTKREIWIQQANKSYDLFIKTQDTAYYDDYLRFQKKLERNIGEWIAIGALIFTLISPLLNYFIYLIRTGG